MTNERAIELLESYDFEEGNPELFQAAHMGAAALREELVEDKPLTPAQLRQICGEKPVWIVREDGEDRWALARYHTSAGLQTYGCGLLAWEDCGHTWSAYLCPPVTPERTAARST